MYHAIIYGTPVGVLLFIHACFNRKVQYTICIINYLLLTQSLFNNHLFENKIALPKFPPTYVYKNLLLRKYIFIDQLVYYIMHNGDSHNQSADRSEKNRLNLTGKISRNFFRVKGTVARDFPPPYFSLKSIHLGP
jgi:hypothetical protein